MTRGPAGDLEKARADLFMGLKARRLEMEKEILARVIAVSGPAGVEGGEYADGLQSAVLAGVRDGLAGVEPGGDRLGPVPAALLTQALQAARSGVTLDLVLRRYIAGYTLFSDFIMEAAEDDLPLRGHVLRPVLHAQAARFEQLVVAVTGEYTRARECECGHRPPERHQVKRVKGLLAGDLVDASELAYEFDDWHVGAITHGGGGALALRGLAEAADRRLLLVRPARETVWAWFGGRRRVAVAEIARVSSDDFGDALVAFGEPARGVEGWRLTHQQADAALGTIQQGAKGVVRYADVSLLASISQDHVFARSLRQLYLAPLAAGRNDGGAGLLETLRAYFAAGRNVSSAAAALGVSRQTVGNRLRAAEEKLDRTLESCTPEIEIALRLEGSGDLVDLT